MFSVAFACPQGWGFRPWGSAILSELGLPFLAGGAFLSGGRGFCEKGYSMKGVP